MSEEEESQDLFAGHTWHDDDRTEVHSGTVDLDDEATRDESGAAHEDEQNGQGYDSRASEYYDDSETDPGSTQEDVAHFKPRAQHKRKHQTPLLEAQLMAAKLNNHLQDMTESRFYDSTLDF